jgi:hypothetical protein
MNASEASKSPAPTDDTTKVAQATGLLQKWVDQQSHDRCWYYPEIFRELCSVFGVQPTVPAFFRPDRSSSWAANATKTKNSVCLCGKPSYNPHYLGAQIEYGC